MVRDKLVMALTTMRGANDRVDKTNGDSTRVASHSKIGNGYKRKNCHSLVLILILISIKTRSDNIFGPKPPTTHQELNLA